MNEWGWTRNLNTSRECSCGWTDSWDIEWKAEHRHLLNGMALYYESFPDYAYVALSHSGRWDGSDTRLYSSERAEADVVIAREVYEQWVREMETE